MKQQLQKELARVCHAVLGEDVDPELSRPDEQFGDYSTNVALVLAKKLGQNPSELASKIKTELEKYADVEKADVAGPGFINISLKDEALAKAAFSATELVQPNVDKEILVEFGDPNPFKEMHIGHAYSYIVGDAIASLLEVSGAKVERLSYHGDVGRHVARALWGMKKEGVKAGVVDSIKNNIGYYYALGAKADIDESPAKSDIDEINASLYQGVDSTGGLYQWGKERSFGYFDQILHDLEIHQPERFLESKAAEAGQELVDQNIGKVFEKSEGAVVFKGEKAGLHTRVFLTSAGLPTYEAKDLGLAQLKDLNYPKADKSLIVTAHEQAEYFKVMLAALGEINKPLAEKTKHLYHGFVSLSSGKMSSRSGDVYSATSLIVDVEQAVEKQFKDRQKDVRNAAIKYGFLKHRLGSDIVYDVNESLSLEGNSGPYLQYAHARAASILAKASPADWTANDLDENERALARKTSEFPEVVAKATTELMPHHICTYLYELAQQFNHFYEKSRVVGDERQGIRLKLVSAYKDVLKCGLQILNIEAPDKI